MKLKVSGIKHGTAKQRKAPSANRVPDLMDRRMRLVFTIFAGMVLVCLALALILPVATGLTAYESFNLMLLPLMVMGAYGYVNHGRWMLLGIASLLTILAAFLLPWGTVETILIVFGFEGAAVAADMVQRLVFFRIIRTIEFVNQKPKRKPLDLLALYVFNIPAGLDTRRIAMDSGIRRSGMPFGEIFKRLLLALFFCLFLWMFMFANEDYSTFTYGSVDAVFVAMGYIAIAVLSLTSFETLNVRVETDHGGFKIYDGLVGTMSRIVIPLALATVLLAIVLWRDSFVLVSIGMSAVVMVGMVVLASNLYYGYLENQTVRDINEARKEFMPGMLCDSLGGEVPSIDDAPPGTPRRDQGSCFDPVSARKN